MATIITEDARTIDAVFDAGRVLIDPAALPDAIGWELKAEGLCRDDVCVPVRDRAGLFAGDALDVVSVANVLGRPIAVDDDAQLVAIALPSEQRRTALKAHQAPAFALPDLDGVVHSLEEWRGRKKVLIAWATW
jgi:hypothetical protein